METSKMTKKIGMIAGAIVGVGVILGAFPKISVYIEAPQNIEANAGEIQDIKSYIEQQRIQNDILKEIQEQQMEYYRQQQPIYNPSPQNCQYDDWGQYWCWNGWEWEQA